MSGAGQPDALLELRGVSTTYQRVIPVLHDATISVRPGSVVALLGRNGAGKSTTLKAISGLLRSDGGAITRGQVAIDGADVTRAEPRAIVRRGVALVMEGRRVFAHLTVEENLVAGSYSRRRGWREDVEQMLDLFPRLRERRHGQAGYLSGGEQQMLAIARALMSRPRLLMLDEPSLGLAPLMVQEVFAIIGRLNREHGVTILLIEQNARVALGMADHGYVMDGGRVVLEGRAADLRDDPTVRELYLGVSEGGTRASYRELKRAGAEPAPPAR